MKNQNIREILEDLDASNEIIDEFLVIYNAQNTKNVQFLDKKRQKIHSENSLDETDWRKRAIYFAEKLKNSIL